MMKEGKKAFTIVIADDDLDDQYFLMEALKDSRIPHTVTTVDNGLQLMNLLLKKEKYAHAPTPDLIILDLNMPIIDGFKALEQIRANKEFKAIPVYILSTSNYKEDVKKARDLGANGYYQKTVKHVELVKIIREVCLECLPEPGVKAQSHADPSQK